LIRVAIPLALAAAAACAGPRTTVPTGFGSNCAPGGTRIAGESQMGVTNEGLYTDVDAKLVMTGRTGGGCFGAAFDVDDR
jgi:hypothetical protein